MASLYSRARSPFWWVKFREGDTVRRESTGLRIDDAEETAQAQIVLANWQAHEARSAGAAETAAGWGFVEPFLADLDVSDKTRNRYYQAWKWIALFCTREGIKSPRDVRFRHAAEFVSFRTNWKKRNTGSQVGRNTAILDVKVWSIIMQRAVQEEIVNGNPLVKLGMKRDAADEKPEITPAEFAKIEEALHDEPEWMQLSWAISRYTGCRLRETVIPMRHIDFERGVIHFEAPKGGKKRAFSVPLPPALRPTLERIRDGRKTTLEMPWQPSRAWQQFFRRVGLEHLTFHCLRVTYVTELARRDVPRAVAMRLVNHGSELVHRIYQRLNVEDLRAWVPGAEPAAPAKPAKPRSPAGKPGRRSAGESREA